MSVFESDSPLTLAAEKPKKVVKAAAAQSAEDVKRDKRAAESRAHSTSLTADEVAMLVQEFIRDTGATSYSEERGRFTKPGESTAFTAFRLRRAPDVIANRE
jgi:hypothetical protein